MLTTILLLINKNWNIAKTAIHNNLKRCQKNYIFTHIKNFEIGNGKILKCHFLLQIWPKKNFKCELCTFFAIFTFFTDKGAV